MFIFCYIFILQKLYPQNKISPIRNLENMFTAIAKVCCKYFLNPTTVSVLCSYSWYCRAVLMRRLHQYIFLLRICKKVNHCLSAKTPSLTTKGGITDFMVLFHPFVMILNPGGYFSPFFVGASYMVHIIWRGFFNRSWILVTILLILN